jgi:hypothetical protein
VPWATFCIRCQEAADNNLDPEEVQAPSRYLLSRAA